MHASIAAATYRGFTRQVRHKIETFDPWRLLATKRPSRRGPWLRTARRGLDRIPGLYVVYESQRGEGKQAELTVVIMDYVEAAAPYWSAFVLVLHARRMSIRGWPIPVKVTAHALQRLMQRLNVTDPRVALKRLWTTVHAVWWIGPPTEGAADRLLPVQEVGARLPDGYYRTTMLGAAVMVCDREDPDVWAMVTFIDAAKLRPEQTAEVRACAEWASNAVRADATESAA
jgi:hypothetical protein